MIKQLITDISYDRIKLSQALTRAKLIANIVDNDTFVIWLKKEIEGYMKNDPMLPEYRRLSCTVKLQMDLPYDRRQIMPLSVAGLGEDIAKDLSFYVALEPISAIEYNIQQLTTPIGNLPLPVTQVIILQHLFEENLLEYEAQLSGAFKEVGKVQLDSILEMTNQKLLDILLKLNSEFPTLEDNFAMTEENQAKAQNIITNNIYGDNNPLNIAAGHSVEQKDITNVFSGLDYSKLEKFGIEKEQVEELKVIVESNKNDKPALKAKAMKWLGGVTSSVAGRGLYDSLPDIVDFVQNLV